jgi:hypothetical protein
LDSSIDRRRGWAHDGDETSCGRWCVAWAAPAHVGGDRAAITYLPVSHDAKRRTLLGHGVPKWIVDMIEEYARAYVAGWGDFTTDTVADLLGHPPRDIADFVRDHTAAFTPGRRQEVAGASTGNLADTAR